MANSNHNEIISIAMNDSDWKVRKDAVSKITDDNVLKDIFRNDSVLMVKITAANTIADVDFLSDECMNNPQGHIRHAILNRILDENLLEEDRLNSLLAHLALTDPEDIVRQIACKNLGSEFQEIFIYIAKSQSDETIRCEAASKITDEDILKDLAINDENIFVRLDAISNRNMTDIDALVEVVKNDENEFNRFSALSKILDGDEFTSVIFDRSLYRRLPEISRNVGDSYEDYFQSVFRDGSDEYASIVAVNFITDNSVLEGIVLECENELIVTKAIGNVHFKNQEILRNLIERQTSPKVILVAFDKIEDEHLLIDYLKKHMDLGEITLGLISKVSDIDFLDELSRNENTEISNCAARRLIELKYCLLTIAMDYPLKEIRLEAISQITDKYDLASIAHDESDRDIAIAALNNIVADRLIKNYLPSKSTGADSFNENAFRAQLDDLVLNQDKEIQMLAVSKLNVKKSLDEIINGGYDTEIVDVAKRRLDSLWHDLKMIDNEKVLGIIAENGDDEVKSAVEAQIEDLKTWRDRISKINGISDIDELKYIANNDYNYYVRCEAEGRLENLLFDVRLDEVNLRQNQEKFKCIADDETYPTEIRNRAFLKIIDERYNPNVYERNLEIQRIFTNIHKNI
ncbi:hypothetical protein [uncultured Methanobrevibacter sp.]|uniref:hypothetical protein n=1 Tax=uncultured Methanobrevibacter sp. TaxID=253161 RepID=UPI0026116137|nr:hypothetical protein [uncultured Methanobrevibacter sp.]